MNYDNLLKQAQAHYDSIKDAADVEPAIMMAGFALKMYEAGQRAERERIAEAWHKVNVPINSYFDFYDAVEQFVSELRADPAESGE